MLTKNIMPLSFFKANTSDLLEQINNNDEPIVLTQNGYAKAVVLGIAAYEELKESNFLRKMVDQSEKEIEAGQTIAHRSVFESIRKKMKAPK